MKIKFKLSIMMIAIVVAIVAGIAFLLEHLNGPNARKDRFDDPVPRNVKRNLLKTCWLG